MIFFEKVHRIAVLLLILNGTNILFAAEQHIPREAQQQTPPSIGKSLNIQEIENDLTIGKSGNENLVFRPSVQYEQRQNADAVQKLEGIRKLRGDTNQWGEVARLLQEVLATDASKAIKRDVRRLALLELAGIAEKQGQLAQAQQLLAEYIERYPDDIIVPEIFLRQAYIFRQLGANGVAISKLYLVMRSALSIKAESLAYYERVVLTAQSEIAETYYMQGDYKNAAEFYSRLLKSEHEELNLPVIKVKLIRSLAGSDDSKGIIKQAAEFLNNYPTSEFQAEMRYRLAAAHKTLGEKQESLRELLLLLTAVEVADENTAAKWKTWKMLAGNEIGNQLFIEGDTPHALQVYMGLLNLDSSLAWKLPIYYQIGLCQEKNEAPEEAIKAYREILNVGQKPDAKLDASLQMIVDMARFREDILSWKQKLEKSAKTSEPKVAEKTN